MKGGKVVVDADRVIELLDEFRKEVNEKIDKLGRFLAAGLTTEPPATARRARRAVLAPGVSHKKVPRTQRTQPPQDTSAPMILDLDLSKVPFKIKGGSPARDTDPFAFTFLKNRDGEPWRSSVELANAIEQYGKVRVGKFVYQLSKDGVFIQRVVFKEVS